MIDCCIPEPDHPAWQRLKRYEFGRWLWRLKTRIEDWKKRVEAEANGDFILFGRRYFVTFRKILLPNVIDKNNNIYRWCDLRQTMAANYIKHEEKK